MIKRYLRQGIGTVLVISAAFFFTGCDNDNSARSSNQLYDDVGELELDLEMEDTSAEKVHKNDGRSVDVEKRAQYARGSVSPANGRPVRMAPAPQPAPEYYAAVQKARSRHGNSVGEMEIEY